MNLTIALPELADYQKKIIHSKARFTITEASTKSGKTFSHICWLFLQAHGEEVEDGFNYWWVAPVYSQANIAFKRLRRTLAPYGVYRFHESDLIIHCPNGAEIHFKSAERADNLYGEDVYAAVFDEAPRAREEAWNALRTTLSSTEGPCKLIGNFGGVSNWVHKLKEKALTDPAYDYHKITCWDAIKAGILSEDEVLQAKADLHPKIFAELYEAEPTEDEGQLIANEAIYRLFKEDDAERGIHYITADIARLGKDKTVVFVWDGLRVVHTKELAISTIPDTVATIRRIASTYGVDCKKIIVDEDGVGGGVKDYLQCVGFVNNSRPIKVKGKLENFANLKAQCYYKLSEYINEGRISIDCPPDVERALTEELEWVRLPKEIDTTKISIMSKEEIKKQLGRSPDYSDALMLRMFYELKPNYGVYALR